MKVKINKFLFALIFALILPASVFSAESTTPEPYTFEEFPQWAHDLRRTEIITFGSLPMVTIGTSLVYGGILYGTGQLSSFPNPFSKDSSASLSSDQQLQTFYISLGVSALLGIVDLIITLVQRHSSQSRLQQIQMNQSHPVVTPLLPEETHEIIETLDITEDSEFIPE